MEKFYGIKEGSINNLDKLDAYVEEINILGYTLIEDLLTDEELIQATALLDEAYAKQLKDFGADRLKSINEKNLVRCPLAFNDFFLELCNKPLVLNIVKRFLGNYFIINQQNGIINFPDEEHHQSSWHRDLPYQDYIISQPIAISCLFCIDDFNESTGSTEILPYSHLLGKIPSVNFINKNKVSTTLKRGGAIVFNAMLYHKAGYNKSNTIRRGLNTLYSIPLLKQQINLFTQLNGKHQNDEWLNKLLGYDSQVPDTVNEWRENRFKKIK